MKKYLAAFFVASFTVSAMAGERMSCKIEVLDYPTSFETMIQLDVENLVGDNASKKIEIPCDVDGKKDPKCKQELLVTVYKIELTRSGKRDVYRLDAQLTPGVDKSKGAWASTESQSGDLSLQLGYMDGVHFDIFPKELADLDINCSLDSK